MNIEVYYAKQSKYSIYWGLTGKVLQNEELVKKIKEKSELLRERVNLYCQKNLKTYPKHFKILGYPNLWVDMNSKLSKISIVSDPFDWKIIYTGASYTEKTDRENAMLAVGANLFSRQVDYLYPRQDGDMSKAWMGEVVPYLDEDGIFHNEKAALLNNLRLENALRGLEQELDMEMTEYSAESTINEILIWKYGFKLDIWQVFDPEKNDLYPNTADLIEAYLEGNAEELRKETQEKREKRIQAILREREKWLESDWANSSEYIREIETNSFRYITYVLKEKETSNKKERGQYTEEQLQEIQELIEENRRLKTTA